jgi:hypothetical protein
MNSRKTNRRRRRNNKNNNSKTNLKKGGDCGCSKPFLSFGGSTGLNDVMHNKNIVIPVNNYNNDVQLNTVSTRMEHAAKISGGRKSRRGINSKREIKGKKNARKSKKNSMKGGSFVPATDLNMNFASSLGINQLSGKLLGAPYVSSGITDQPIATQYGAQNKFMV